MNYPLGNQNVFIKVLRTGDFLGINDFFFRWAGCTFLDLVDVLLASVGFLLVLLHVVCCAIARLVQTMGDDVSGVVPGGVPYRLLQLELLRLVYLNIYAIMFK
jgi:hypothetical protein